VSGSESQPIDVHEWISFDDPDEHRTWVFDATYLRSNYTCIFGCGCKGILDEPAPELMQGCCSFGAHFVDDADVDNLKSYFDRVEPRHMQFHTKAATVKKGLPGYLRDGDPDDEGNPTVMTELVSHEGTSACIFLNRPGFEGGAGCALHVAADALGERIMSPHGCASGSAGTGEPEAKTLAGGAPRSPMRSSAVNLCTSPLETRSLS
jgi:hypothetical protein